MLDVLDCGVLVLSFGRVEVLFRVCMGLFGFFLGCRGFFPFFGFILSCVLGGSGVLIHGAGC